jgi:hypothetical protein
MKSKKLSLEELTKRVVIIQRFLRKKLRKDIIKYYKHLFNRAAGISNKSEDLNEMSLIKS